MRGAQFVFEEIKWSLILHSSDIYFIGGFGTVAWVDVKEYEALQPDKIAVDGGEQNLKVCILHCPCSYKLLPTMYLSKEYAICCTLTCVFFYFMAFDFFSLL